MAPSCTDLLASLKTRKKLIFFIFIFYVTLLVYYYQGHIKLRELFSQASLSSYIQNNRLQETIRYGYVISQGNGSSAVHSVLDIHVEHPSLGHTGELLQNVSTHSHRLHLGTNTIAIGCGLTSKKLKGITTSNIPTKFQLFTTLLPSFCQTASKGFEYHFYFAYDYNDAFFSQTSNLQDFQLHFRAIVSKLCTVLDPKPQVHFVQCSHVGSPALAQNDAMMEAYLDGMTYYYRINDDSLLGSSRWVELFMNTLAKYDPRNVGVVGPKHRGGNVAILTYDFVHRTHIDIFGFYYPRLFKTWWADDWITRVYQPGRSSKLASVKLQHTMKLGQRYKVDFSVKHQVASQLEKDKATLQRYVKYKTGSPPPPDPSKVIAMSLYNNEPLYTMGAIRNAQLLPVYFPSWLLRVYIPSPGGQLYKVPRRILDTLERLGVQLAYVNTTANSIEPSLWRYFVVDDPNIERFLIRDTDRRFSDREAVAVRQWEESGEAFHCIRDHPSHGEIVEGLWGGRSQEVRRHLVSANIHDIWRMKDSDRSGYLERVWHALRDHSLCHDSVTCDTLPRSVSPPPGGSSGHFIGQRFSEHQIAFDKPRKFSTEKTTCLGTGAPWPDVKTTSTVRAANPSGRPTENQPMQNLTATINTNKTNNAL